MNEISRLGRNKVALASADGTKSADNDACGGAPADTGSLVPPHRIHPGESDIDLARSARISLINASSFELDYVAAAKREVSP